VRVAAIQHDIVWEDRDATLAHLEPMVALAAAGGARLVVLTEMFAVGFSLNTERLAEPPGGPTSRWLSQQARTHGLWICGSLPELAMGTSRPANQLVLAGPGGELHSYAKRHPFSYSGEHLKFSAGDELVTVDVEGVRVSLFICYDLRFADGFWALAPQTDLYLVPANWPASRAHHWRSLLVARAIENQAYVLGANRVGTGGELDYRGDTMIVDPLGEVLTSAVSGETVLFANVDADVVASTRRRFPFLNDRRAH
jgi:predicted amidohydrolase